RLQSDRPHGRRRGRGWIDAPHSALPVNAWPAHADADCVSDQVLRVVQQQVVARFVRLGVVQPAEVEDAELLEVLHGVIANQGWGPASILDARVLHVRLASLPGGRGRVLGMCRLPFYPANEPTASRGQPAPPTDAGVESRQGCRMTPLPRVYLTRHGETEW